MKLDLKKQWVDLDPHCPAFVQNPYQVYGVMLRQTPLFFWEQYGHWCAASHGAVSAALREPRFGRQILHVASRADLGWPAPDPALAAFDAVERHSLLELEPPDHTRLRGLITRAFVARKVEHLRPAIAALAHRLIDGFAADKSTNILAPFATQIPVQIIADVLGVPLRHTPDLLAWSHAMVAMYQYGPSPAVVRAANNAAQEFGNFMRKLAAKRQVSPQTDLISMLLAAHDQNGRLSMDELVATCILVLNAGHEASVHAIGNGVAALLQSGVDPAGAFANASATAATIEEMLRFEPPLHLFTRYALTDFEWMGVAFARGDKIGLLLGAANRDPQVYENPDVFDPFRPPFPHTSFGAGIHFCLGAPLARLELEVALPILFQRLPGLELTAPPQWRDTYHFRQMEGLPLRW